MKITYAILKEYCPVALEPKKLADLLTRHGDKVESIEGQGDNTIFELEITANRPDCLSFIGIAREVALLTKTKTKLNSSFVIRHSSLKPRSSFFIRINDKTLCPIYIGRIIKDIKVGPSPDWLRSHLESLGFRSINNIVDITNWVLMETGQPLHAFDYDKLLEKQIIVRTAAKGEKMTAIDGKIYDLTPEMLVIADAQRPMAIAGVMGGKDTEVTESTKNVLLESAYFHPACIRRTSRQLALPSDSSYRFERMVDPDGVETASQRATGLILELAKGTLTDYQALDYLKRKERKITLRTERISRILGITIPLPEIKRILTGLGITIKKSSAKGLELIAPSFRPDLNIEVDIIEELARIYGYEKIPVTPPCIELKVAQEDKIYDVTRATRSYLVEAGYNEVMTNSFWDKTAVSPDNRDKFVVDEKAQANLVGLLGPDGTIDRFLRPDLIKGLLNTFSGNDNYIRSASKKSLQLFEISKVYFRNDAKTQCHPEFISGSIGMLKQVQHDNKSGKEATIGESFHLALLDTKGFYSVKGALADLFAMLGIADKVSYAAVGNETKVTINLNNQPIGYLGVQSIEQAQEQAIQAGIAELDFEPIIQTADLSRHYQSFIRLPAVTRDLAIVVPEQITWSAVEQIAHKAIASTGAEVPLENLEFFDIYRGKQVKQGYKSIAFSLTFRHPTKTLASEAVDNVVKTVVDALAKDLQATLRA